MSKKSWPILYSNLLYEMFLDFYDTVYKTGQDFFDIQYTFYMKMVKPSGTYTSYAQYV